MEAIIYESDGFGRLGNYVFPAEKRSADPFGVTPESNTQIEDRLLSAIVAHINANKPISRSMTDLIKSLVDLGSYPDIFKYYSGGDVYRGMNIPYDVFTSLFGDLPKKSKWYNAPINWLKKRSEKTGINLPFSPTSRPGYRESLDSTAGSFASSWTTDLDRAVRFSKMPSGNSASGDIFGDYDGISVVLVADSSSNTFIDMTPWYEIYGFTDGFTHEAEVIGVGDIYLKSLYVYR